jgi:hypothetical protein
MCQTVAKRDSLMMLCSNGIELTLGFVLQWDKFYPFEDFFPGGTVIFPVPCLGWYGRAFSSVTPRYLTAGIHLNFIQTFEKLLMKF